MISAAEEFILEGKLEGKMETIQNLLKMCFDWNAIFKATGIDQDRFQKLKEKFNRFELAAS